MRTISVVTGTRADYGIYRPILRKIVADPDLELKLIVCGSHLSGRFGRTVDAIEADGFAIGDRIETLEDDDSPRGIAAAMSRGLSGIADSFAARRPDILLVLGDRYEMLAATAAALPFAIPTAHIHGGELTEGLIDEAIRHSITKMSHLHFASTDVYAKRIIQMGETPNRVFTTGAPGLDNLNDMRFLARPTLEEMIGLSLADPPLLVTFHPVTLEYEETAAHINALLAALSDIKTPIVFTYPNADTFGTIIIEAIEKYVARRPNAVAVKSLGTDGYFSLMKIASAMIGNSSSGIVEAASFELPVVNIGNRQRGRLHGANVIDCEANRDAISKALQIALTLEFRASFAGMSNPYGDGRSSERIVHVLKSTPLDANLIKKRFHNLISQ